MKLWRVVGADELQAFVTGKPIKPIRNTTLAANSWRMPVVAFFGTANNAAQWFAPDVHDYIICVDIPEKYVMQGKGLYPDFSGGISGDIAAILELILTGNQPNNWVREYGVKSYGLRKGCILLGAYKRQYSEGMNKRLIPIVPNIGLPENKKVIEVSCTYDDLVEAKENG